MDNTYLLNNILKNDGTNQGQRLLAALNPDNIKIDERGIREILNFTYTLSKEINFFNLGNEQEGDWSPFFEPVKDLLAFNEKEILAILNSKSDFDPHLALFLTFVKLFRFAQNDLNTLVQKHLDFYYKQVLSLNTKPAVPDKVHLVLELAKNLSEHRVEAGTRFKAVKNGTTIPIYTTDNEIVINKAQIKSLKSIFITDVGNRFNIYSSEVTNSKDGKGKPFTGSNIKWSAFGENQQNKATKERNMEDARLGFAFASPMLLLKEGKRIITLTIGFKNTGIPNGEITNGIEISYSGEKGWIVPGSYSAKFTANQLTLVSTLESVDGAVVPFNKTVLKEAYNTTWPVLKILLNSEASLYKDLFFLEIATATIEVAVDGAKDLVIQNSQSSLNPAKPFLPFGSVPVLDSAFYIGSAEIFQKKLTKLSLDVVWKDVPAVNLGNYYIPYFDTDSNPNIILSNLIFTAGISFLYHDQWIKLDGDFSLFHFAFSGQVNNIDLSNPSNAPGKSLESVIAGKGLTYSRNIGLQQIDPFDNTMQNGFIKLEISGPNDPSFPFTAFGHNEFPNIYSKTAIKIATEGYKGALPGTPYTPAIKSLSVNYASVQQINLSDHNSPDRFFHIEPFGVALMDPDEPFLLPQYPHYQHYDNPVENNLCLGTIYAGIENLVPPQNLNILFQVAEGSADSSIVIREEDIQWDYLSNNKWIPFNNLQILSNTTRAMQTSGIISFAMGGDATNDNTLMPEGIFWLRGMVNNNPAGISQLIDIKTQAIQATYVIPDAVKETGDEHLVKPLPPFSIKDLLVKDAAIKSVQQPYNSFDGKGNEKDTIFYTRVSERLRHKKRALTLWDYERLILDEFPTIFKVKCLTHTNENSDLAPGAISAVVVPNLINTNSVNPLKPMANLLTLGKIKEYVSGFIPLFVDFNVGNPVYEQLLVDFKVGFMEGKDAGYYGNLLNEEIKRFLSPWAYEEGQDIIFGGKVYKTDILVFIENREYVDFVNDLQLYHQFDGIDFDGNGIDKMIIEDDFIIQDLMHPGIGEMIIGTDLVVGRPVEVAYASGPRSILVSAPDHRITVLQAGEYACSGADYMGIGYWAVHEDFIVQENLI